jgi:hypothetical protein
MAGDRRGGVVLGQENVMDAASAISQVALATVFVWAGLSKSLAVGGLADSIERLGFGAALAKPVAVTVIGAELTAAIGLFVFPSSIWPRALVGLLAAGFAIAGLMAVGSKRRIACACFGNLGRGLLGWRQVLLLPLWLGLAGLAQWQPPGWTMQEGLVIFAFALLALVVPRLPRHLRMVRRLREDRVALAPSYVRYHPENEEASQ